MERVCERDTLFPQPNGSSLLFPFFCLKNLKKKSEEKRHKQIYNHSIFDLKLLCFYLHCILCLSLLMMPAHWSLILQRETPRVKKCFEAASILKKKDTYVYEYLEYCAHTDSFCHFPSISILIFWVHETGFLPDERVCACVSEDVKMWVHRAEGGVIFTQKQSRWLVQRVS